MVLLPGCGLVSVPVRLGRKLIDQQRPDIAQGRHIEPREGRPTKTVGFPSNHGERRSTLQTEGVENQQAEHHRQRENR